MMSRVFDDDAVREGASYEQLETEVDALYPFLRRCDLSEAIRYYLVPGAMRRELVRFEGASDSASKSLCERRREFFDVGKFF